MYPETLTVKTPDAGMSSTFKKACPDLRNTRVVDVIRELEEYNVQVDVYDPWIDAEEAQLEYGITPVEQLQAGIYDGIVLAVAYRQFREMGIDTIRKLGRADHVLYDLKSVLPRDAVEMRL
jgi:UDP-N-acetyl-D-galactosamine dehydrogenase